MLPIDRLTCEVLYLKFDYPYSTQKDSALDPISLTKVKDAIQCDRRLGRFPKVC
ncbi:hypothetical protein [Egbenema bharatensis]|uniref:hypothetical protein n=1 Tax=Egbenema bharatensis TaxID=3463334 RepID=UPI003A894262